MEIRIDNAVIRGWIDNTTPGETRGGVELVGFEQPLQLILRGNCCRDLAGTRLDFVNPKPIAQPELSEHLHHLQRGVVGEMTVSQRVKVPLITGLEFEQYLEHHKEIPFAWHNSIYLEWFSLANGRVFIEATDFQLKLSNHQWELDHKADSIQKIQNEQAVHHFLDILKHTHDAEAHVRADLDGEADEYEWEKRLRVKDGLEEALHFLNSPAINYEEEDDEFDIEEDAHMQQRFSLVRKAFLLQNEVMLYLGNSYLDHGPRGELAMAVAYIFSMLDEAWPEHDAELENGYKIAMLKRAIDASIAAISACNKLEMEDDAFATIRGDIFEIRDDMISLKRGLRAQTDSNPNE